MQSRSLFRCCGFAAIGLSTLLVACGGGSSSNPPLSLSPTAPVVDGGTGVDFSAAGGQPPYTFVVSSGQGSISPAGRYTAPGNPGSAIVSVRDSAGVEAQSTVTIQPALTITPGPVAVAVNTKQTFEGAGGTPPYTYSVLSGPGTITSIGQYVAPSSPGNATLQVRDSLGTVASTVVTVNPVLSMSPASITITAGSDQTYVFAGQGGAADYQYTILSGPGTIDAHGVYTAGSTSGHAILQVSDRQGATATATVQSIFVRTNGPVHAAVTDGVSWYLGGTFTAVNAYEAPHFSVINSTDGSPVLSCDLQTGFDDVVNTTVSDATGVYVGGYFSHYRGVATPGGLVKIDPNTCNVLTTYFLPTDGAEGVFSLAVNNGALYVNTRTAYYQGTALSQIISYQLLKVNATTGVLDPAFTVGQPVPQIDRMLVMSSGLYYYNRKLDPATGTLDPNYNPPVNGPIYAMVAAGGAIYLGGWFGNQYGNLIKVDPNSGARDPAFSVGFDNKVYDLAVGGSSLYAAGSFSYYGGTPAAGIAKLDLNTGVLDANFTTASALSGTGLIQGGGGVRAIATLNGAVYAVGQFVVPGPTPAMRMAKLDGATGIVDTVFTQPTGLNSIASAMCVVANSLYVGGAFTTYRGAQATNIAKINISTGKVDHAFTQPAGTDGQVSALLLANGSLYLGGEFANYDNLPAPYLTKVDASTGLLDTTFTQSSGLDQRVFSFTGSGNSLFAAGEFTQYRGVAASGIIKLDLQSGSMDPVFVSGIPIPWYATLVATNGSPWLFISDYSPTYGGSTANPFGRIDAVTGAYDTSFSAKFGLSGSANSITFAGNAGFVDIAHAVPGAVHPSSLSKFDATSGTVDPNFVTDSQVIVGPVLSMLALGKSLYVAARPTSGGSPPFATSPVKVDATTGATDSTFSQWGAVNSAGTIRVLSTTGTDLYIGGDFTSYRGGRAYFFTPIDPLTGAAADPL